MKNAKKQPPKDIVERTFHFAVRIIHLCGKLDENRGVGRIMMSQILRAGTSVPANVEEAQAAQSKAVHHLFAAALSVDETAVPQTGQVRADPGLSLAHSAHQLTNSTFLFLEQLQYAEPGRIS